MQKLQTGNDKVETGQARKDAAVNPMHEAVAIKSDLPATWFGFLWKNEPLLLALSGFAQLFWSSFIILGAYYFVSEMNRNRDQQRGLELCFL